MNRALGKLLMLCGAVWLLWTGYALLAPEAEDQLPHTIVSTQSGHEVDLLSLMAGQLGASITRGNSVQLLLNGEEIFPAMLQSIRSAQQSIRLLSYVYWQGEIAHEFAQALISAADRGLEVRLILDAWGAKSMEQSLVEKLMASDVEVAWFHPIAWYNIRRINQRTHRKVLIVDGSVGFTGGVGIARQWTGNGQESGQWRDSHFRITGPAVFYLDGAFRENWLNANGEVLAGRPTIEQAARATEDAGDTRLMVMSTSPRGDMSPIALLYWTALTLARDSVDIATPYFAPDHALLETIMATARRGVRVRLLLPGDRSDSRIMAAIEETFYENLLDAGVEVHLYQPTMSHTKTVIVDEQWSIVGSANFDNRSFELNDEIMLLSDSQALNRQLREAYESDLERSVPLTDHTYSATDRLRGKLYHLLLIFREQL